MSSPQAALVDRITGFTRLLRGNGFSIVVGETLDALEAEEPENVARLVRPARTLADEARSFAATAPTRCAVRCHLPHHNTGRARRQTHLPSVEACHSRTRQLPSATGWSGRGCPTQASQRSGQAATAPRGHPPIAHYYRQIPEHARDQKPIRRLPMLIWRSPRPESASLHPATLPPGDYPIATGLAGTFSSIRVSAILADCLVSGSTRI